ncbi:MAG: V-type ATP synthase subunit E [Spirochaetaceae bacterium]|jgi:V/A-type H+-transporting ATPase subunit E|nr:V-type ATP synthase subunit E [Spirochaetaceae bacterium]
MDIQLQELIDKIKKDGIESASEEALKIKKQAEAEAEGIIGAAKKEADALIAAAKEDAARTEKASIAAVEQASRNLVLAFKDEIQTLLDKLVQKETGAAYGADTLKNLLPDLVKGWAAGASDSVQVLLRENDRSALEAFFRDKLASALKGGVELKTDRNLGGGFRIAEKDGRAYYDFSVEAVAELLSAYLNPRLAEILKDAVKGA